MTRHLYILTRRRKKSIEAQTSCCRAHMLDHREDHVMTLLVPIQKTMLGYRKTPQVLPEEHACVPAASMYDAHANHFCF